LIVSADLQSEIIAVSSYLRLLTEAQDCKRHYEKAGIPLPTPLLRLLGEETIISPHEQMSLKINSPDIDSSRLATRPPEATKDWISIRAKDASPTTIALALLRDQDEPVRAKDLAARVHSILPNTVGGSIYNLLNRLEADGIVSNKDARWTLENKELAGVLTENYLWAPSDLLTKTDLAAHRREAIVHLLRSESSMQIMEIVDKLHRWEWVKAPVNKDLLKIDMQVLDEQGLARRIANTRNWEAVSRY
jgi:hypothetical protein